MQSAMTIDKQGLSQHEPFFSYKTERLLMNKYSAMRDELQKLAYVYNPDTKMIDLGYGEVKVKGKKLKRTPSNLWKGLAPKTRRAARIGGGIGVAGLAVGTGAYVLHRRRKRKKRK